MPRICMESLDSVCPLAQNHSSLLPPRTESLVLSSTAPPKQNLETIPSEQLCFSVFFLLESTRGLHQTLAGHIPPLTTIYNVCEKVRHLKSLNCYKKLEESQRSQWNMLKKMFWAMLVGVRLGYWGIVGVRLGVGI